VWDAIPGTSTVIGTRLRAGRSKTLTNILEASST
jgi:hypothetical protein